MPGDDQQERWTVYVCPKCQHREVTEGHVLSSIRCPWENVRHGRMEMPGITVAPEQATRQSARADALREAAERFRRLADTGASNVDEMAAAYWAADLLESLASDSANC